jgi:hypothetical protein
MKTISRNSRPLISQTANTITLWVGHLNHDPNDHLAGQTFECPAGGELNNIQVFSSAVTQEGELELTLHEFDHSSGSWGPSIGDSSLHVEKKDAAHWISFNLQPIQLEKGKEYAFRLKTNNGLIGLGEAASNAHQPFPFGRAWSCHAANGQGRFYKYFSLAFKVELCA